MKTLAFTQEDRRFYCVNGVDTLTDEDYDPFVNAIRETAADGRPLSLVVSADGAAPNALQRSRLNRAIKPKQLTSAILTESAFVRGVIMAFGWTGTINARAFSPTAIDKAVEFLGWRDISPSHVRGVLAELRSQLGSR